MDHRAEVRATAAGRPIIFRDIRPYDALSGTTRDNIAGMRKKLAILWLCGMCLRLTVLAIPPVIPMIHESLRLSQAQVGALVSLPVLLFSIAAVPGSLLIARFGAGAILTGGLFVVAVASALRGASFDLLTLYATTFAMGIGIAIMQPALPAVVREQLPANVGLGTAVFSNGLLVGEALSASLTIPWLLPVVDGNWRLSLVAWSIPVFAIGILSWRLPSARHERSAAGRSWWPDWRSPLTWRLGFVAGGSSSLYFATNAFLPDYLHRIGRPELIGSALSALNWVQLPASFLLLAFPGRLMRRRWPFVAAGIAATAAVVGLGLADSAWLVFWSGIIGFCTAFVLILTLALPPMLVAQEDVHRVSAAMFAIGYLCALVTPVMGGFAWDVTGIAWTAFAPAGALSLLAATIAIGWHFDPSPPRVVAATDARATSRPRAAP
jgi:CP family cyanate transporter-like MFS transporter